MHEKELESLSKIQDHCIRTKNEYGLKIMHKIIDHGVYTVKQFTDINEPKEIVFYYIVSPIYGENLL